MHNLNEDAKKSVIVYRIAFKWKISKTCLEKALRVTCGSQRRKLSKKWKRRSSRTGTTFLESAEFGRCFHPRMWPHPELLVLLENGTPDHGILYIDCPGPSFNYPDHHRCQGCQRPAISRISSRQKSRSC